jgi:hypothetical protein
VRRGFDDRGVSDAEPQPALRAAHEISGLERPRPAQQGSEQLRLARHRSHTRGPGDVEQSGVGGPDRQAA